MYLVNWFVDSGADDSVDGHSLKIHDTHYKNENV